MAEFLANKPANEIYFADDWGRKMNSGITIDKATSWSQEILDDLFGNWHRLRVIMRQHELTLNKRWLKKTAVQRKATLLEFAKELPQMHRPELAIFRNKDLPKKIKPDIDRETAMYFPQLNVEDLSQPKNLLLMLDSRSRNFPSVFAPTDLKTIRQATMMQKICPLYVHSHTMYLNGQNDRGTYGHIVSWKDDPTAITTYYQGVAPDPGLGLMILKIQKKITHFLVLCCVGILHDIPQYDAAMNPMNDFTEFEVLKTLLRLEDKICSDLLLIGKGNMMERILEAPYRTPDTFDSGRLRSLVDAKHHQVHDQLMLLREDPGYFAEHIEETCSYTREALVSVSTEPRFMYLSAGDRNDIIRQVLHYYLSQALIWKDILRLIDDLTTSYRAVRSQIKPGEALPERYTEAVFRLETVLIQLVVGELWFLQQILAATPTFQQYITMKVSNGMEVRKVGGESLLSDVVINHAFLNARYQALLTLQYSTDDLLFWLLLESLDSKIGGGCGCDLAIVFQEIELLITKDQKQKDRLTPTLLWMISDLALVAEILRQIQMSTFRERLMFNYSDEEKVIWEQTSLVKVNKLGMSFIKQADFAPLIPDLRVFDYPWDKPRTATSTAQLRTAEQALDAFWAGVDELCVSKIGSSFQDIAGDQITPSNIQRTLPWIPVIQEETFPDTFGVRHSLLALVESTKRTIEATQTLSPREKTKTRAPPPKIPLSETSPETATPDHEPDDTISITTPRIKIKKKAFNTFAALFGKPVADTLPGEIPWSDFKRAMVNVGFGAEKLQGSAWLFASSSGNIIFHEPHPESKMPMQWARRIARRLSRNFGWTMETFVLENRTTEGAAQ
ncbi:MAG: hypothetical protein Q9169_005478 [Polycauliona sp. 2 TL-2023]